MLAAARQPHRDRKKYLRQTPRQKSDMSGIQNTPYGIPISQPTPPRHPQPPGGPQVRYAVVGAGAIGAYVGASLARAGADVVLVARGPHLTAMRRSGLRVISPRGDYTVTPGCTDSCADVGPVDVVIIALKAHQIAGMLGDIAHLMR